MKARRKIAAHGGNVHPLQGYGLLVGTLEPLDIYAALPVGKTSRWDDRSDCWKDVERAMELARPVASAFDLEIVGHYVATDLLQSFNSPPQSEDFRVFLHALCPETNICGIRPYLDGKLQDFGILATRKHDPRDTRPTHRRILSAWLKVWGPLDYGNNHEAELAAQYGPNWRQLLAEEQRMSEMPWPKLLLYKMGRLLKRSSTR